MKITYLFPSRSRPEKFRACVDMITNLSASDNFEIIGVIDNDDKFKEDYLRDQKPTYTEVGNRVGKIVACNAGIPHIDPQSEIICLMSDDFKFTKKGFDDEIRNEYADGFKGLLHVSDGRVENEPQKLHAISFYAWMIKNEFVYEAPGYSSPHYDENYTLSILYEMYNRERKQRLVTFPIMHKEYLERFGYIYYPEYKSVCCDDEMTEVAKILGQYKWSEKNIMVHEHYRNGFGEPDELMQHNESPEFYQHDRELFAKRQSENFGIK